MQNNYYFLKHLSKKLNELLIGEKLTECFSQNKDELLMKFTNKGEVFHIKALLSPNFTCLSFPSSYHRAGSNTIDLFQKIIGKEIQSVQQHTNERAFSLHFANNFILTFKLFGNKANILLFENEIVIEKLQSNLKNDDHLNFRLLNREINFAYEQFQANNFDIERTFPTFGKKLIDILRLLFGQKSSSQLGKNEAFYNFILTKISDFSEPKFYINYYNNLPYLSLLPTEETQEVYNDPILALNIFFLEYSKIEGLIKEKAKVIGDYENKIIKYQKTIAEVNSRLQSFENGATNEQIGHILMANLHEKVENFGKIELFDFYRNENIFIKLKEGITLQKNAENFYRKAKNEKIEIQTLEAKLLNIYEKIEKLHQDIVTIKAVENLKQLKKFINIGISETKLPLGPNEPPFKIIEIEGWQIWIGKNAINNDLLTQKYAKKDDLWLHARDVAGSHVIIRFQAGKVFPKNIIERAAELAAFYSKRRNDTVCPVIVTQKKFVRKPKNLPAGKVIVEKDSTLLVEPKGP